MAFSRTKQRVYDFSVYEDKVPFFPTPWVSSAFAYRLSRYILTIPNEEFGVKHRRLSLVYGTFNRGLSRLEDEVHTAKIHERVNFDEAGFVDELMQIIYHTMLDNVKKSGDIKNVVSSEYYEIPEDKTGMARLYHCNYLQYHITLHNQIVHKLIWKYSILSVKELRDALKYADPTYASGKGDMEDYVKKVNPSPLVRYAAHARLDVLTDLSEQRKQQLRSPVVINVGKNGTEKVEKFINQEREESKDV